MFLSEKLNESIFQVQLNRFTQIDDYWKNISKEEANFLIATSMLMDGKVELGEKIYEGLPSTFKTNYNLYLAYQKTNNEKAKRYETILEEHYSEEFALHKKQKINKKIAYFLPHLQITGGMKMIFLQKKILEENGYQVDFFIPYAETNITLPITFMEESYQVLTYKEDKEMEDIAQRYPIAIAPHWDYLHSLWTYFPKVFYYLQGDYDIFSSNEDVTNKLKMFYRFPHHLYGVSHFLNEITEKKMLKKLSVHPCPINLQLFKPGEKYEKPTVLVIGRMEVKQKKIKETLDALLSLREKEEFDILWVTPENITHESPFIQTINNPTQETLGEIYRKSHVFVTASTIEGFSLPPLEAMASGTAVVSTDNGGNREYSIPNENILLFEKDNWNKMKQYTSILLKNKRKRELLEKAGMEKAAEFHLDVLTPKFIAYFESALKDTFITKY